MSNKLKVFIIVCVAVFLTGLAATVTGMALHGWRDLDKLPGDWILPGEWHINEGAGNTETYSLQGNDAEFKSMDLNLSFCDVDYKQGDAYGIELTYDTAMDRPEISIENGVLSIVTGDEHFISGEDEDFAMTVEITVPEGTKLDDADLSLDACQAEFSGLDAKNLDVSFDLGQLIAEKTSFVEGKFNLNLCDATIELGGESADYDYDIVNGLGSVSLEGTDLEKASSETGAPYYYQLDADLSDVTVTYQWPSGN